MNRVSACWLSLSAALGFPVPWRLEPRRAFSRARAGSDSRWLRLRRTL